MILGHSFKGRNKSHLNGIKVFFLKERNKYVTTADLPTLSCQILENIC